MKKYNFYLGLLCPHKVLYHAGAEMLNSKSEATILSRPRVLLVAVSVLLEALWSLLRGRECICINALRCLTRPGEHGRDH
jgi:hypothetical protein